MKTVSALIVLISIISGLHTELQPLHAAPRTIEMPSIVVQSGHAGAINAIALDQTGLLAATAGNDGDIRIWDLASRKLLREIVVGSSPVLSVDYSSDGKRLAAVSLDGSVSIWNPSRQDGELIVRYENVHIAGATAVRFTADGSAVISSGKDGRVYALSAQPQAPKAIPILLANISDETIDALAFAPSPHHDRLCAVTSHGAMYLWSLMPSTDPKTGISHLSAHLMRSWPATGEELDQIAFSPSGALVAAASSYNQVCLFDVSKQDPAAMKKLAPLETDSPVQGVAFINNERLITGLVNDHVELWSLATRRRLRTIGTLKTWVQDVEVNATSNLLVAAGGIGTISLWDISTWTALDSPSSIATGITTLVAVEHGNALEIGRDGRSALRWRWSLGDAHAEYPGARSMSGTWCTLDTAASATDGSVIAWGLSNGDVAVTSEDPSSTPIAFFPAHNGPTVGISIATRLHLTASIGQDDGPRIYSYREKRLMALPALPDGETASCIRFSRDETRLACGTHSGRVILWDTAHWRIVLQWQAHDGTVNGIDFSPTHDWRLITCGNDRQVKVWDTAAMSEMGSLNPAVNQTPIRVMSKAATSVMVVAYSPDGKFIVSGDMTGTIRFFPEESLFPSASFSVHSGRVTTLLFVRNGSNLCTAASDGRIAIFDMTKITPVVTLVPGIGANWIAIDSDSHYASTRHGTDVVAFGIGQRAYPFEQFDLLYNRPDRVLAAFDPSNPLIAIYRAAVEKRLKQKGSMAVPPDALKPLPTVTVDGTDFGTSMP